jgi:hypothetical protein
VEVVRAFEEQWRHWPTPDGPHEEDLRRLLGDFFSEAKA